MYHWAVTRDILMTDFAISFGKSFHDANFLIMVISEDNLFDKKIRWNIWHEDSYAWNSIWPKNKTVEIYI